MNAARLSHLAVLAYAQGFTLWHYRAPGRLAETLAAGFFAPAAGLLEAGDMVLISARDGGGLCIVSEVSPRRGPLLRPLLASPVTDPAPVPSPPAATAATASARRRRPLRAALREGP